MAAERVARLERGLEVDLRAGLQVAERGQRQGLARDVGGEAAWRDLERRQAAAADADAVAIDDARHRQRGHVDPQAHVAAARLERTDGADVADDPGEHVTGLLAAG